ncbi:MAG: hypothetical protein WBC93_15530 [Sulfitobacter sp.]
MKYYFTSKSAKFSDLLGQTLKQVRLDAIFGDRAYELHLYTNEGLHYILYHAQDCCEDVYIESIVGDLDDLVGCPILMAEEAAAPELPTLPNAGYDSYTWTFYKLATIKGYVDIRWFGCSNGYYSESVDFVLSSRE